MKPKDKKKKRKSESKRKRWGTRGYKKKARNPIKKDFIECEFCFKHYTKETEEHIRECFTLKAVNRAYSHKVNELPKNLREIIKDGRKK